MYCGSIFYLAKDGVNAAPVFNLKEQMLHVANVFGGTVFVFIFHHSISGIVYPIRPQTDVKSMFLYSHIIGAVFLGLEGMLAYLAFSGRTNNCSQGYPCRI
jgi:Ca2+/Na+ antiporter